MSKIVEVDIGEVVKVGEAKEVGIGEAQEMKWQRDGNGVVARWSESEQDSGHGYR